MIDTLILALAESPSKKDTKSAVPSLTPHPPILIGKVIENKIIGENTKKAKQSIVKLSDNAEIIQIRIYVMTTKNE